MTFFLEWPTEAKFFFVFGCLVALILPIAGLIRVRNNHRTTRRFHTDSEKRIERGGVGQSTDIDGKITFGVSAMDDDDEEVHRLWNTRASTDLHTALPSPAIAVRGAGSLRDATANISHPGRSPSVSSASGIELSQLPSAKKTREHSNDMCQSRAGSTENARGVGNVTVLSGMGAAVKNDKVYLSTSAIPHKVFSEQKAQPLLLDKRLDQPMAPEKINISNRKHRTYVINEVPKFDGTKVDKAVPDSQNLEALGYMEAHRRFHAAESGQLQRRARYSIGNIISPSFLHAATPANTEEHRTVRSITWPVTDDEVVVNMTVPQSKPQRRISPPAMPFRAFVETHPPPKSCPSAWTRKTQSLMDEKLDTTVTSLAIASPPHSRSPSGSSEPTTPMPQSSASSISIYGNNARKINAGFEVLPAGTLEQPTPFKDFGSHRQDVAGHLDRGKGSHKSKRRSNPG